MLNGCSDFKDAPNGLAEDIWQRIAVSTICAPANILEFRHAQTSGTKLHKMGKSTEYPRNPGDLPLIIAC